jgi:hypothetical protein
MKLWVLEMYEPKRRWWVYLSKKRALRRLAWLREHSTNFAYTTELDPPLPFTNDRP